MSPILELADRGRDVINLRVGHSRVNGETKAGIGGRFRERKGSGLVTKVGEASLQVQRHGVVERGAHALGLQVLAQLVPLGMAHDVEVVHALGVGGLDREHERGLREQLVVPVGDLSPGPGPGGKVGQLDRQNRPLDAFHSIVVADLVMVVPGRRTMLAQAAGAFGKVGVVGHQGPGFAAGSEVLARIEAESGNHPECSGGTTLVFCAMGLRRVLDQGNPTSLANLQDWIQVKWMSVEMHRHDRLGPRRDRLLEQARIEIHRLLLDVDKDGLGADVGDGPAGRDEGEGRRYDLVAGTDVEQAHRDMQRRGSAVEAHAILRADEGREIVLEF